MIAELENPSREFYSHLSSSNWPYHWSRSSSQVIESGAQCILEPHLLPLQQLQAPLHTDNKTEENEIS